MPERDRHPRATRVLRIAMLAVIAIVALTNALGWVDADLWIPFVCIIAVMGVGTRGGPVDALSFVLIEAAVVLLLGVATFSASRDAIWAASVAVSVLAIGKIAVVEMHRRDAEQGEAAPPAKSDAPAPAAAAAPVTAPKEPRPASEPPPAPMSPAPVPRVPAAALGASPPPSPATEATPGEVSELTSDVSAGGTRKRRTRDDPTPKAVRLKR